MLWTMTAQLLAIRDVETYVGLRHSKIYALIRAGEFPAPCKVGRASRWRRTELDDWIAGLAAAEIPAQTAEDARQGAAAPSGDVRTVDA